jgi:SAM-dependent methyltransferase
MTHHSELLNLICDAIGAEHYLEIGTYNREHNFNLVKVPHKVCVDPDPNANADFVETSDQFFRNCTGQFDIIFIDGLHHADQVRTDIRNAWNHLRTGGVLVIHDSNPPSEPTTCVPRGSQREWCGDVYKTVANIRTPKFTVDFDYGCCVIRKSDFPLAIAHVDISYDDFDYHREKLLNLVSTDEAKKRIGSWI